MVDTVITLYDSDEEEFETNGLGSLSDATLCNVIEERNGEFELEMQYPITGNHYNDMSLRKLLYCMPNPYSEHKQAFRIYDISKPINGIVTISAQHISYDLSGLSVPAMNASVVGPAAALANIRDNLLPVSARGLYEFSTDKESEVSYQRKKPMSARSALGGTEGSILDVFGSGEYEFDNFDITLHSSRGSDNGVSIRYGKNLTDLTEDQSCENVYSGVYPYWYSNSEDDPKLVELDKRIINVSDVYEEITLNFNRILVLDMSDKFEEEPTQLKLEEKAKNYIKNNKIWEPKVSLDISFINLALSGEYENYALLEQVHLCDLITVEFPDLGVSSKSKCIKTDYNVLTGRYNSISLGDVKNNISDTIVEQFQEVKEDMPSRSFIERAVDRATKLITGNEGGYVVFRDSDGDKHPDEILIMDEDTIADAEHVWRWNQNGLGFSSNGYDGPYETAITSDGAIVADFITTGRLDGNIISANSISASSIQTTANSFTEDISSTIHLDPDHPIDNEMFVRKTELSEKKTKYEFEYTSNGWKLGSSIVDISEYGITLATDPVVGNKFIVDASWGHSGVTISGNNITAGTIDARVVNVDYIDAGNIKTGNIDSRRLVTSVIQSINESEEEYGNLKINASKLTMDFSDLVLTVYDDDQESKTYIELSDGSGVISSKELKIKGNVTFNDLKTESETTVINGSNITTGTIDADRISVNSGTGSAITITSYVNTTSAAIARMDVDLLRHSLMDPDNPEYEEMQTTIDGKGIKTASIDASKISANFITVSAARGLVDGLESELNDGKTTVSGGCIKTGVIDGVNFIVNNQAGSTSGNIVFLDEGERAVGYIYYSDSNESLWFHSYKPSGASPTDIHIESNRGLYLDASTIYIHDYSSGIYSTLTLKDFILQVVQ